MKILEELVRDYQLGSMTQSELRSYLGREIQIPLGDRRKALELLKNLGVGIRFFKRVRGEKNGSFSQAIPEELAWRKLILLPAKDQAKWYKKHCPEVGTPEYNLFKRLCKAFGIGGNEFYYWLRKLR